MVATRSVSAVYQNLLSRGFALHGDVRLIDTGPLSSTVPIAEQAQLLIIDLDPGVPSDLSRALDLQTSAGVPVVVTVPQADEQALRRLRTTGFREVRRRPDLQHLTSPAGIDPFVQLLRARFRTWRGPLPGAQPRTAPPAPAAPLSADRPAARSLLVIGASTGGPQAVRAVLERTHIAPGWAVAIVQHISPGFAEGFARWLSETTQHTAGLAHHGELIRAGTICVAPGDHHLRVRGGRYTLDREPKRLFQRPSADNLFESAAAEYADRCLAVLLTGMGRDGAEGCSAVRAAGGYTVVQDQESAVIWGMPGAAVQNGAADEVVSLLEIGERISGRMARAQQD